MFDEINGGITSGLLTFFLVFVLPLVMLNKSGFIEIVFFVDILIIIIIKNNIFLNIHRI